MQYIDEKPHPNPLFRFRSSLIVIASPPPAVFTKAHHCVMILPFHLVKVCGDVIFAAQGCDIHSFNSDFKHISTWKYPAQKADESGDASKDTPQDSPAPEEPPTKRRKVESGAVSEEPNKEKSAGSENGQSKSKKAAQYDVPANERPFVQGLYATADGRHLIAITGSDKTIWVFEHDGTGNLKQLSQR